MYCRTLQCMADAPIYGFGYYVDLKQVFLKGVSQQTFRHFRV